MEAYKTTCPDCGNVRFWSGYKTGVGKTPEQLQKMSEDLRTCTRCGSKEATTELDHESETGRAYDEMNDALVHLIAEAMNKTK